MRILIVFSGEYRKRHLENIRQDRPKHWSLDSWRAPRFLPPMIDNLAEFRPEQLPEKDLIRSRAEHRGAAELLREIVSLSGGWGGSLRMESSQQKCARHFVGRSYYFCINVT